MRSIRRLTFVLVISTFVLTGCLKETSTAHVDGSCKREFIDAYNATGTATNKVAELMVKTGASGAEYSAALEDAQAKCRNLMTNFGDGGECKADRKGSADELKSNCLTVDEELERLKSYRNSEFFGEPGSIPTVELLR